MAEASIREQEAHRASVSMGVRVGRQLDDVLWFLRKRLGSLLGG